MTISLSHTLYKDEQALAKGCKEGNAQAQKALYDAYAEPLMIVCLRYAANSEDARDMLMQSLVACFKSIGSFNYLGEGSLRAWLKKVTVNQCLMQLRKKRELFRELDSSLEERLPALHDHSPVMQLTVKEIMVWIHELPDGYRTVFNLYVFEDMSHKEIAALLGISENTSKSQLHKARALLQNRITESQSIAL